METFQLRAIRVSIALLIAVSMLLVSWLALQSTSVAQAGRTMTSPLVLAAYQAWHGLPNHASAPYTSTDPLVIANHIQAAKAQGIAGFVVDWYGKPITGVPNAADRDFIDQATAELIQQSEDQGFYVALLYDEGTISAIGVPTTTYTTRVISDLLYAKQYFTMPAYLKIRGHPAVFVFPYDNVDPYINWPNVRNQLGITVTLLDKDPNPLDPAHDAQFDGFYAWVQPTSGWQSDGMEWGEGYLRWFSATMASPAYTGKVSIGGVWPGFDDTLAAWGSGRYMWRRCGQTWRDTWRLANESNAPIVMIDTWNDFEEGSDIEYGIGECLTPPREQYSLPGGQVVYTHTLANTGKFTDTFNVAAGSLNAWPTVTSPSSVTLPGHASTSLMITLTVPQSTRGCTQDTLIVTATSELSPTVHSSLVDTTKVLYCAYLPIILKLSGVCWLPGICLPLTPPDA